MQAACLRLRLPEWRKDRRAEGATEREGSQEGRKPRRSSRLLELGERDRGARGRGCWPSVRGGGGCGCRAELRGLTRRHSACAVQHRWAACRQTQLQVIRVGSRRGGNKETAGGGRDRRPE